MASYKSNPKRPSPRFSPAVAEALALLDQMKKNSAKLEAKLREASSCGGEIQVLDHIQKAAASLGEARYSATKK